MSAYVGVHRVTGITVDAVKELGEECITRKIIAHTEHGGRFEFLVFGVSVEALAMTVPDAPILAAAAKATEGA